MTNYNGKKPRHPSRRAGELTIPKARPPHLPVRPDDLIGDVGSSCYPFIVIRLMSAVYQAERICVRRGPTLAHVGWRTSLLQHPDPVKPNGQIDDEAKALLIGAVLAAVKRTGLRMCVVWGPAWCSFVEADGSTKHSFEPPSGGFQLPRSIVFDSLQQPGSGSKTGNV